MVALFFLFGLGVTTPHRQPPTSAALELEARRPSGRPPSLSVSQRAGRPEPSDVIAIARQLLGYPYAYGGNGVRGYDCSGYVNEVFAQVGYHLPRISRELFKIGLQVPRSALVAGDLVFFSSRPGGEHINHVGIYVEDDEFIHAVIGKGEVAYDRLTSNYYRERWAGARRILTLPPGRYSTRRGLARPHVLFSHVDQIPADANQGQAREDDTIGQLITELTEQKDGRQVQLATWVTAGRLTHVGPLSLEEPATGFELRLGAGRMADSGSLLLTPALTYFDPIHALRVEASVPLQIPVGGKTSIGDTLEAQWSTPHDYTKVIKRISLGQRESRLFVDLSRTTSQTLGHGHVMRYYTPSIASRVPPDHIVEPNALSLTFAGSLPWVGVQSFADDLWRPQVAGGRVVTHPFVLTGASSDLARELSLAAVYALDARAPYRRQTSGDLERRVLHALGLEAGVEASIGKSAELVTYADLSTLIREHGSGVGGVLGALLQAKLSGRGVHVLRFCLEARLSGPSFVPGYFDVTYRLDRLRVPGDQTGGEPTTKLMWLETLESTPTRWGIAGEFAYHYTRRIGVGLAYEDGGAFASLSPSERSVGRNLMLFAHLRNLYLPHSRHRFHIYLAYHLRSFAALWPVLVGDRPNEYVFLATSVELDRYLILGGSLRKAQNPRSPDGSAEVDAMVQLTFNYEI